VVGNHSALRKRNCLGKEGETPKKTGQRDNRPLQIYRAEIAVDYYNSGRGGDQDSQALWGVAERGWGSKLKAAKRGRKNMRKEGVTVYRTQTHRKFAEEKGHS